MAAHKHRKVQKPQPVPVVENRGEGHGESREEMREMEEAEKQMAAKSVKELNRVDRDFSKVNETQAI